MKELYYDISAYIKSYTTRVKEIRGNKIILEENIFYPTGGGVMCDRGSINGCKVLNVIKKDDIEIEVEGTFTIGEEVLCEVDFEYRYDLMKQHSLEHILSGIVHKLYGYENIGFHLTNEHMLLDFNGKIEDIEQLEDLVNQAIESNQKTNIYMLENQNLNYRSKKELEGDIRIVELGEYDCCACCGLHVMHTGEIGYCKIIDCKYTSKGTRLTVLGSKRARDYMNQLFNSMTSLANRYSTKRELVVNKIDKLEKDLATSKSKVNKLISMISNTLNKDEPIIMELNELEPIDIKTLVQEHMKVNHHTIYIQTNNNFILANNDELFASMKKDLKINGGGKGLIQGKVNIEFMTIKEYINERI